jgi:hypothetical protein
METEVYRIGLAVDTVDDDAPGIVTTSYMHYLGMSSGELGLITEMGLFNASTLGTLFAHVVFDAINKTATSWIKIDWEIQWQDDGV